MADPAAGGMGLKKTSVGLAIILALVSGLLGNGLNLNGFGARAASIGGAFVGLEYLIGQKRTVTEGMMPGVYEMKIWVPMLALGYGW